MRVANDNGGWTYAQLSPRIEMQKIREIRCEDIDELFAIEQFATAYPWSRQLFADGLLASGAGGEFGWCAEVDGRVVAFAIFNAVLDEATLLNTAVQPAYRRRGIARELLTRALHELPLRGIVRCLLEVRVSNARAIALYEASGFTTDGHRRNYYPANNDCHTPGGREDALLMSCSLPLQYIE